MDFQEIIHYAVQIEKHSKEGNYEDIISFLDSLDSACVSVELLQETELIRVLYRILKACPQPSVKKRVKRLLSKWKKLYCHLSQKLGSEKKEGFCLKSVDLSVASEAEKSSKQNVPQTGSHQYSTHAKRTETTGEEIPSLQTHSHSTPDALSENSRPREANPSACDESSVRSKCVQLLLNALKPVGSDSLELKDKIAELAEDIEQHIYTLHSANQPKYKTCVRSKVSNLRNPKNEHLRQGLLSGSLDAEAFARMSVQEMASMELQQLREEYSSRGVSERQLPQGLEGTPTQKIRCRRCEGSDCTVTQVSRGTLFLPSWVRRGNPDEDAMTFVTCSGCGEQWYHSGWVCL